MTLTYLTRININVNTDDMIEKYHHGNLFTSVIEQAFNTIEAHGFDAFTLRKTAREIGVDSSAIYRHFKSKDAVAAHVARKGFGILAQDMLQELAKHTDAVEKLVAIGTCYIHFAVKHPNLFDLMFNMAANPHYQQMNCDADPALSPSVIFSEAWQYLLAQENKPTSSAATGQFSLWSAVHGCANLLIQGHGPKQDGLSADYAENVCRNMIRGCLAALS